MRLPPEDYYRLWNSIEAETKDLLFPIRLCETIRSESFSPPLFAALCSPNLLVAARRVAQYKALIGPMRLRIEEAHDVVTLELTWLDAPMTPPISLAVMELLFCVSLARMGTREPLRPIEVTTTALPSPLAPYEVFLGTVLQQGSTHRVSFTQADATRPFLTSNELMWATFEPELRRRLADLSGPVTTAERVRSALLEGIPSGLLTIEAMARKLVLSKRTLQRRLEEEGTSYQQVLTETREALARHYLEKTALPAAEVAFLLALMSRTPFIEPSGNGQAEPRTASGRFIDPPGEFIPPALRRKFPNPDAYDFTILPIKRGFQGSPGNRMAPHVEQRVQEMFARQGGGPGGGLR